MDPGMTPAARLGYHVGQVAIALGVLVAICVFTIKWYRARKRQRAHVEERSRRYNLEASTRGRGRER